ncbi:DUF4407 domain-containing protein [Foetidibacter luteolus]|uniref:DUF4407 domain-containing protein n=1 Tax=Foetidibacter luteolus TaxID=2608880 RepID=UPI00129ACD5C|nr:DUF4407 domain-containing protein [Foetidibacter luteolus]
MADTVQSLAQRGTYRASVFTKFLWWLSTAEEELLEECIIDRNRYAITGMTVLGTWLFATLAWTFFFTTVTSSLFTSILLGLFMGGIILCIDRALIKGITAANKQKIWPMLFRGLLACTIGFFMAQPALLYLFDKEVHLQISLDNEGKKRVKSQQLDSLYLQQKNFLLAQKQTLQQQETGRYSEVSAARDAFIDETDGTGGSKKPGLKDIARAKELQYQKLDEEYNRLQQQNAPRLHAIDSSLAAIETTKHKEQQAFEALLNDGFLTRIEALQHLVQSNSAVQIRYYLLVMLLMLIELMPVIAKSLLPTGTYDEKIRLREKMEKTMAENNYDKELALKELYNQTAFEQDSAFIRQFFEQAEAERKEKMRQQMQQFKKDENRSFDSVWKQIKEGMLSKQEN